MDGALTFRSAVNSAMGAAAICSIAYMAIAQFRPDLADGFANAPIPTQANANAPDSQQGWRLGAVIERFIDADREFLGEREGRSTPISNLGSVFSLSGRDQDAARETIGQEKGLRERFNRVIRDEARAGKRQAPALYLPINEAPRLKPAAPPRPAVPSSTAKAASPANRAAPRDVSRPARPQATAQRPSPPAKPAAPATAAPAAAPPRAPGGFKEVTPHTAAQPVRQAAAPGVSANRREDDAEAVETLLQQSRRDIRNVPYALAAGREFIARYPRDSRAQAYATRMADLEAAMHDELIERRNIGHTTILAEVQFCEEARSALAACLASSGRLERVTIVARELRHHTHVPAFMVALRAKAAPEAPDEKHFNQMLGASGPCLVPLFHRGTVAIFHASHPDHALAIARIEALGEAAVHNASHDASKAVAKTIPAESGQR